MGFKFFTYAEISAYSNCNIAVFNNLILKNHCGDGVSLPSALMFQKMFKSPSELKMQSFVVNFSNSILTTVLLSSDSFSCWDPRPIDRCPIE